MDIKAEALIWAEMVSAGIVPLTQNMIQASKQAQIVKLMEGLSEDDMRRLKRKFRKLWRKASTKKRAWPRIRPGEPSASEMRRRKQVVFQRFYRAALEMIKKSDPYYDVVQF